MALDELERQFYETAKGEGMPDDQIAAKIRARRDKVSPAYKLTDYAGEAAKLPPQPLERLTAEDPEGPMNVRGVEIPGLGAVTRFLHRALPDSRMGPGGRPNYDDPVAHDPTAQAVLAGTLGAGAGTLAAPLGRIVAGGVNAGTQTAVSGGDLGDVAGSALIGAAIPAAGMAARKIGNAITGSKGGQARALFERHGGNVGPLDSGSGIEEIAGVDPTRRNLGETGIKAAKNIRTGLAEDFDKTTGAPYRAAREAVDFGPAGQEPVDISSLRGTIADHLYAESTPTTVRPVLKAELDRLDALRGQDGRVMVSQSRLNEMKQRLQDMADFGVNTGAGAGNLRDRSFKAVANAAKVLTDEGPYASANATYSEGMRGLREDRSALGLKKSPAKSEAGVSVEDRRVGQILRNLGNDSEAAGAMSDPAAIAAFVERHPELARQVDLPSLLRAKDTLSLHGPGGGGALDNLIQMTGRAGHGVTGKAIDALKHNAGAINGRVLYTPGKALGAAGGAVAESDAINQIIAAYQAQRQRDEQRAQALGR